MENMTHREKIIYVLKNNYSKKMFTIKEIAKKSNTSYYDVRKLFRKWENEKIIKKYGGSGVVGDPNLFKLIGKL